MKSLIKKNVLRKKEEEERRTKQSLHSPQMIESNNNNNFEYNVHEKMVTTSKVEILKRLALS